MATDITLNEFRSSLAGDVARSNRFLLSITKDAGLVEKQMKFLITKASIQRKSIDGPEFKYRGRTIKIAGDFKRDILNITLWNDSGWVARKFFENWLDEIVDTFENVRTELKNYITSNSFFELSILGLDGEVIAFYTFQDCFPFEISEIDLDQNAENQLQEFRVSFNFTRWIRK